MPMSEQEAKDLEAVKEAIKREKLNCYSYLSSLHTADEKRLLHSGYGGKTNAEAMRDAFKRSLSTIDKLLKDHVRKYPDD